MGTEAPKGEHVLEHWWCPVGWMVLLGSEVGSNSAFWMCVGWLKCQSVLGNDSVAWVAFCFTGQKDISRVAFEKVVHWLSLASFFYISNAAINKMCSQLLGADRAGRCRLQKQLPVGCPGCALNMKGVTAFTYRILRQFLYNGKCKGKNW